MDAGTAPAAWRHGAPVPGLANESRPSFPGVDRYLTQGNIRDQYQFGLLPKGSPSPKPGPHQSRNCFWYQMTFRIPTRKQTAFLKINKAQFGTLKASR